MAFAGFPDASRFLVALSRNDDRVWFDAHRAEFERALVEPATAFVAELGARLREVAPGLQAIPRVGGSIKALERRMRFPKGGPPFKEYFDLWFWTGRRRAWENTGFFLRLTPERLSLSAGMIEFQKETLARYRQHLLDGERGAALEAIVRELRADGVVVGGESYKKTPRGFTAEHPRAALAKHGGLFAVLEGEHPDELGTAAFVDYAFSRFSRMAKLHAWLVELTASR